MCLDPSPRPGFCTSSSLKQSLNPPRGASPRLSAPSQPQIPSRSRPPRRGDVGRGERLRSRAARSEPGDLQQLPGHSQGTPCNYRPQNFLLLLPISSSSPGPHAAVPSPLWVSCRGLAGDTDATGALTAPLPPGRARGWAGGCGMGGVSRCVSRCLRFPRAWQSLFLSPPCRCAAIPGGC